MMNNADTLVMNLDFLPVRLVLILITSTLLSGCFMKGKITTGTGDSSSSISFSGADSAVNVSATAIQINWTPSSDASITAYNIYIVNADTTFTQVGAVSAPTALYVHSGLTSGHLYRYVVRAAIADGTTDSNTTTLTAIPYAGIATSSVVDGTTVDLTFPAAPEANNLKLYCATGSSPNGTMNLIATLSATATTYRWASLTTGQAYTCKVKAVLPDGSEDANTTTTSFTPQSSLSFGFAGISSAANIDDSSALIQWSAATPDTGITVSSYIIYYQGSFESTPHVINNIANNLTSYTVSGLTSGYDYSFIVRAFDGTNSSTDGNVVRRTAFTYAGITSATATSTTTATLNFPAAPNASDDNLHIYCYESSGTPPSTPTAVTGKSTTSYSLTGLTTSTNYTCLVKAVGLAGEDSNTATATFTTP